MDGAVAGFLAGMLVFAFSLVAMRPLDILPVNAFGSDLAHSLLAIKLIGEGWRLHGDIGTPLGVLAFLPSIWGAELSDTAAGSLVAARLVNAGVIVLLTPLVCWRRLSALSAALLGATMVAVTLTPTNLGEDPWRLAFAMEYNKMGFALAGLGFCLLVPGEERPRRTIIDIVLAAALVTLCFHLKITYAFVLAGGLTLGFLLSRRYAASVTCLLVLAVHLVVSGEYLRNILEAGFEDYETITRPGSIVYAAASNIEIIAIVLGAALVMGVWFGRSSAGVAALALIVLIGGGVLLTQNSQRLLVPSAAAALIILFEAARRMSEGRADRAGVLAAIGVLAALYPAMILGHWLLGVWHYNSAQRGAYASAEFESGPFSGVNVNFETQTDLSASPRDCRDPGSLENYLAQVREIAEVIQLHPNSGGGAGPSKIVLVDHVDLPVLFGQSPWSQGSKLWRVSATAITARLDEARFVLVPRFSKLRTDYLDRHAAILIGPEFQTGSSGCMDYYARR